MRWAEAAKILKADPVKGSRTIFKMDDCKETFKMKKDYLGVAGNIFWFNLKRWAVQNQNQGLLDLPRSGCRVRR